MAQLASSPAFIRSWSGVGTNTAVLQHRRHHHQQQGNYNDAVVLDSPAVPEPQQQHLVLVGGGHAHVQVMKALHAASRPAHVRITLIDTHQSTSYSGMIPGCIAGIYQSSETQLHLSPLAEWADVTFIQDRVIDIDFIQKQIIMYHAGPENPIHFDIISIDIGSTTRGLDTVPGAARYTIPTRPIDVMVRRIHQTIIDRNHDDDDNNDNNDDDDDDDNNPTKPQLVVVGGGIAGIELAMSVTSAWQQSLDKQFEASSNSFQRRNVHCTILHTGSELLSTESFPARQMLVRILHERNIHVRYGCIVHEVQQKYVVLHSGEQIPFTHCLWATGAGSHQLAWHLNRVRGLDVDRYGWIQVRPTMQSIRYPYVFGAGDCVSIIDLPYGQDSPPKAGVFAVRAGPVLIENLIGYIQGKSLIEYQPQHDFLKLLVCGKGQALGLRFGMAFYGSWVFQLKDHIDKDFMRLFDVKLLPPKPQKRLIGINAEKDQMEEKIDTTTRQYDDDTAQQLAKLPRMNPVDAARYLMRTDDFVDYIQAWAILRLMAQDDVYCEAVQRYATTQTIQHQDGGVDENVQSLRTGNNTLVYSSTV